MKYSQQSASLRHCIAIATLAYSLINLVANVSVSRTTFFVKTLFMIMYTVQFIQNIIQNNIMKL